MISSLLIIGYDSLHSLELGGDLVPSVDAITSEIRQRAYHVVVLNMNAPLSEGEKWLSHFHAQNPQSRKILIGKDSHTATSLCQKFAIHQVLASCDDPKFRVTIEGALELALLDGQKKEMAKLLQEQNEKLQSLYVDLEKRVEHRQHFLLESEQKVFKTNKKLEILREALSSTLTADSSQALETSLNKALEKNLHLEWTRIFYRPQDQNFLEQSSLQMTFSLVRCPIFQNSEEIGSIFYLRSKTKPFQKEEVDLLNKVSEGASLAIGRVLKRNQSQIVRHQWEATFNALSDPVCIVDKSYNLLQANESFLKGQTLPTEKKCFEVLFKRDSPCETCVLGHAFRLETLTGQRTTFDVSSHSVRFANEPFFVNVYRDHTEQLQLENKLIESAKLAELGTIGSSIAHELNNPLGGILAYVQLLRMESSPEDPHYEDYRELENGTLRCRDIIQNLLTFSRKTDYTQKETLDLNELVQQAVSLFDVQTRSSGIEVSFEKHEPIIYIQNNRNLFLQLLTQVLSLFQTEIKWDSQTKKNQKIFIKINRCEDSVKMSFTDMSLGASSHLDQQLKNSQGFDHVTKPLGVDLDIFSSKESIHTIVIQFSARLETRF